MHDVSTVQNQLILEVLHKDVDSGGHHCFFTLSSVHCVRLTVGEVSAAAMKIQTQTDTSSANW